MQFPWNIGGGTRVVSARFGWLAAFGSIALCLHDLAFAETPEALQCAAARAAAAEVPLFLAKQDKSKCVVWCRVDRQDCMEACSSLSGAALRACKQSCAADFQACTEKCN
jgi:hypothetical protein